MLETCDKCGKAPSLCVCAAIVSLAPRTKVLILQHPQEPDKTLGTAQILNTALSNSVLRVGLSWRNLSAAVGSEVQAKDWAVLYLGSVKLPAGEKTGDKGAGKLPL